MGILGAAPDQEILCGLCGGLVVQVHCKLRCTRCGYTRDCSDP